MQNSSPKHESIDGDWFATAFGAWYPVVYAHRTVAAAAPEAEFAQKVLHISPDDRLLDLCCGNGRHLVHLAKTAPQAAGLDYSADLLRLARENIGASRNRLLRGDMRALPFADNTFDAITNFFTSFGYFQDAREDRKTATEIARVLRPGGRFFIDYLNESHVKKTLIPHSERRQDQYLILETRWIDPDTNRVNKRTEVEHEGRVLTRMAESVRLYSLDELAELLDAAGLEINQTYGDYEGNPTDPIRPRLILSGHRTGTHG
jgi:ubiquinone/menaquinone biosynthesis C-methylase UbiE